MEITTLTDARDFLALGSEWNDLLDRSGSGSIFLTWEWTSTWWSSLAENVQPNVLAARQGGDGRLVGVAPLMLKTYPLVPPFAYRELCFLGTGRTAPDHLDFIIDPAYQAAVADAFVDYLCSHRSRWHVVRFEGVASSSPVTASLLDTYRSPQSHVHLIANPYLPLPATWDAYAGSLGRNLRNNIARYDKLLEKEHPGQVRYWRVRHEQEIDAALSTLFRLNKAALGRKDRIGSFEDPRVQQFHRRLAREFLRKGWLRFYLLTIGTTDIAALYCFRYRDVVSFYQSGFDLAWDRYGPGRQLMAHAIRESIDEAAREFDFLRGDETYKSQWTAVRRNDLHVRIASGVAGWLAVNTYQIARKVRKRLRRIATKKHPNPTVEPAGSMKARDAGLL
jgi:CelD/BcsL family acetyltransferase involved in cellulose biosynthesis